MSNSVAAAYPADVAIERPVESSRLWALLYVLFGIKVLALILHFVIAFIWGIAALVLFVISQFVVLFTGAYPTGMHAFLTRFVRWSNQLSAWTWGLTDEYPPFVPTDDPFPMETTVAYPDQSSRLWAVLTIILVKFLALVPHFVVLYVLGLVQAVLVWIANLVILFTGEFPESLFVFCVGVLRWQTRVTAFTLGLCDGYPPFSLS